MSGEIIAVALGLPVGLSLGALGGGGSTLAVPILVFVAGLNAQDATTASLLVVGVAAAVGVSSHFRDGNVRLGAGIAFGAAGVIGSRVGLLVNRSLDEHALLLGFSLLVLLVAIRMYRSVDTTVQTVDPMGEILAEGSAGSGASGVATLDRVSTSRGFALSSLAFVNLAGAATAVGLLTGLFGVGGGFAVVPALTLLLRFPAKEAIGTSLVVIAINAAIALGMRSGDLDFDWVVVGPFLATVSVGVIGGFHIAKGIDAARLTRAFALMLGFVAISTAASTVFAT